MALSYPTPEDVWHDFAGEESPRDFVVRLSGETVEVCVEAHLNALPSVFGIMRNGDWGSSFRQPWQLRRDEVRHGLLAYLEANRDVWAVSDASAAAALPAEEEMDSTSADYAAESDVVEDHAEVGDAGGDVLAAAIEDGSEGVSSDQPPAGDEHSPQSGE